MSSFLCTCAFCGITYINNTAHIEAAIDFCSQACEDSDRNGEESPAVGARRIRELENALLWYIANDDTQNTSYNKFWYRGKLRAMKLLGMAREDEDAI